jgi:hypothetical protein
MRRVRTLVARSEGKVEFIPLAELWAFSGILADTFPLDRELARGPRPVRRAGHWMRLLLVDQAVTNPERTAYFSMSDTPWVPAVAAAVVAAAVAPRLPRWVRLACYGSFVAWALQGGRAARYVAMRRQLSQVAPGAVLVADFVTLEPDVATTWMMDALASVGDVVSWVGLLPASGDERRDAARERLYERRLGVRVVGRTQAHGQPATIVVLN